MNSQYNSNILFNRACAYAKTGKTTEAIDDLTAAITINPDYAKAYMKRGDIRMQMEKFEDAVRDYE